MRMSFPGLPGPARRRAGTPTSSLALILAIAVAITSTALLGCSADPVEPSRTPAPAEPTDTITGDVVPPEPPELATTAEVGRIVGRLPGPRRKSVRKQVTRVVDRWWEASYLGAGSETDLATAFPGFTIGASTRARFDRKLMTNTALGADSIMPLMRKVRLDLLAVRQRVRSVTARFDFRVRTTGDRSGRLRVRGRLFLTRRAAGWRIFGYDVSKGWL